MAPALIQIQPVEKKLSNTIIRVIKDDLTALPVDAFVFYARRDLEIGSGYGTAIQQRGGASVKKELEEIGSVEMGEAVITGAGQLNARHIIHACGPKFHEPDLEGKLRRCLRSALRLADEKGLASLALPPLGYGFYGVPADLCARAMVEEITGFVARGQTSLREIIICVADAHEFGPFKDRVAALSQGGM